MRVMVVLDMGTFPLAVISIPPKMSMDDLFWRWFKSEQNNNFVCEEDCHYYELKVLKYKDLTIEGEEDDDLEGK